MALVHLAKKYSRNSKTKLYVALLDMFDSVVRELLWAKLSNLGIDPGLLFLIQWLYLAGSTLLRLYLAGALLFF